MIYTAIVLPYRCGVAFAPVQCNNPAQSTLNRKKLLYGNSTVLCGIRAGTKIAPVPEKKYNHKGEWLLLNNS
jgi:hypothetical protein